MRIISNSLELRRRIRQDSDSERQQSYTSRSEVIDGSASFVNTSNHNNYKQSSQNSHYEERSNYNYGKLQPYVKKSMHQHVMLCLEAIRI